MAKSKKAPRKRKPEYAAKRPVVSVRVDERVFGDISAEARARDVSVTDVVYHRLPRYEIFRDAVGDDDLDRIALTYGIDRTLAIRGFTRDLRF